MNKSVPDAYNTGQRDILSDEVIRAEIQELENETVKLFQEKHMFMRNLVVKNFKS